MKLDPPAKLDPLQAPDRVSPEQSAQALDVEPAMRAKLDAQIESFLQAVLNENAYGEVFKSKVQAIHDLGSAEIRAAAGVSNRLLEKPVQATKAGVYDQNSAVSRTLVDLRRTVEDLDPSRNLTPRRILGIFPGGNKVRDYFLKYESAQKHLNAIITSLYHSKDELQKDNAAIEQEKVNLWDIMQKLKGYAYVGQRLDAVLSARLDEIAATDPEKARVVREEMLYYTRQKVQDLLTQLAVSVQGYLALDLVKRNNLELIKGVDRATTTTVSALRTAVLVSQALAGQKVVLDQIGALNATTSNLVESTSVMLRQQTAATYQQAAESAVNVESLQKAFDNVYATLDAISQYKSQALDQLQRNVNVLSEQVTRAQTHIDRVKERTVAETAGVLGQGGPKKDFEA
ncbi:toxic anion resistance protein [Deinococcus pimensis]|uniref:toxic anion resistance protein n=1 Tax=Deinococcus pimensis TaxID=309888 RepID=UPI000487B1A5|nr:toxic anion resistance protein [Deinococcus pimensis]